MTAAFKLIRCPVPKAPPVQPVLINQALPAFFSIGKCWGKNMKKPTCLRVKCGCVCKNLVESPWISESDGVWYSQRRPVGRDFPAYCIWKLAKFGWYPGFWLRGLWVGVLNLSQLTPPVSRKSYRDNRWIIFHLLNSAYCIRVPDGLNCPRSQ